MFRGSQEVLRVATQCQCLQRQLLSCEIEGCTIVGLMNLVGQTQGQSSISAELRAYTLHETASQTLYSLEEGFSRLHALRTVNRISCTSINLYHVLLTTAHSRNRGSVVPGPS